MRLIDQPSRRALVFSAAAMLCVAYCANGQDSSGPILPTEASAWINSSPITAEMLKGKAALLYFYEET